MTINIMEVEENKLLNQVDFIEDFFSNYMKNLLNCCLGCDKNDIIYTQDDGVVMTYGDFLKFNEEKDYSSVVFRRFITTLLINELQQYSEIEKNEFAVLCSGIFELSGMDKLVSITSDSFYDNLLNKFDDSEVANG